MGLSEGFNTFGFSKVRDGEGCLGAARVGSLNSSSSEDLSYIMHFALCHVTVDFSWQLAEDWENGLRFIRRLTEMNVLLQSIFSCLFFFFLGGSGQNF